MRQTPVAADFLAPAIAVTLVAAVLFAVVRLCRKRLPLRAFYVVRYLSFFLVLIPLNGVRAVFSGHTKYLKSPLLELIGPHTLYLIIVPLSLVGLWFLWVWQKLVIQVMIVGLVSLVPFSVFTFAQAIFAASHAARLAVVDQPPAPMLPNPNATARVLWVIFDEWDFRLTFKDRPAHLEMPAVERFAAESISAVNVRSPAMDTGTSVPSLLTGRRLRITQGQSPIDVSAEEVEGPERLSWNGMPTMFLAARQAGYNTAVVGWYLPYCRMFNFLNDCAWWPMPTQATSMGDGFWSKVSGEARSLLETDTLSVFGQSLAVKQKTAVYLDFLKRSEAAVSNPRMGFVFLHVPVPHAPHAYNRATGKFDLKNNPLRGYIDSLALLDKMLASLRQAMERNGVWDKTAILLTADHPFREAQAIDGKFDARVPYLLKMPGQRKGSTFTPGFNSIVTADLLMSVLEGNVVTASDASAWLQAHQRDFERPLAGQPPRSQPAL